MLEYAGKSMGVGVEQIGFDGYVVAPFKIVGTRV